LAPKIYAALDKVVQTDSAACHKVVQTDSAACDKVVQKNLKWSNEAVAQPEFWDSYRKHSRNTTLCVTEFMYTQIKLHVP
jgi:hypothetical protein